MLIQRLSTGFLFSIVGASLACGAAVADVPEGDVWITLQGNRIVTGLIAEDESFTVNGTRVFYGELGVDVPNVGSDPGFKAFDGVFTSSTTPMVGIAARKALRKWNGTDFSTIATESMRVSFGPTVGGVAFQTPGSDPSSVFPGLSIPVDEAGGWHHHPDFELIAAAGQFDPSDGVYLIELELFGTGVTTSEPIWVLWGQNASVEESGSAYEFAAQTIPSPASNMLLGGLAMGLSVRRRRSVDRAMQ